MDKRFEGLGFGPADILLPTPDVDMTKWAVVACDQFTSQPEYWQTVEQTVGEAPSTLRLILPEASLNAPDVEKRIADTNRVMERYLKDGTFRTLENALVYVERTQSDGTVRRGLVGAVDLEQYDFHAGSDSLIRATEETVPDRLPPRMRVRQHAPLELPHVELLMDDPACSVIEPLTAERTQMETLYDFDLQQNGGHITGRRLTEAQITGIAAALRVLRDSSPMLFAVGDGNHSLAAAKRCYEAQPDNPLARYALVEIMNSRDAALHFAPIHRVLFGAQPEEVLRDFQAYYPDAHEGAGPGHSIRYVTADREGVLTVPHPTSQLEVGTLQNFLDAYLQKHPEVSIDYIHGDAAVEKLGQQAHDIGFFLPAMEKAQLFQTVQTDGALPRKSFSMGQASDKRYYIEGRRIR